MRWSWRPWDLLLLPVGLARQAEIHPGFDLDVTVLSAGFFAIVLLISGLAVLPALERQSPIGGRERNL